MKKKTSTAEKSFYVEDDLSVDEAIFLIEWGYDITDSRIKQDSKKKIEG